MFIDDSKINIYNQAFYPTVKIVKTDKQQKIKAGKQFDSKTNLDLPADSLFRNQPTTSRCTFSFYMSVSATFIRLLNAFEHVNTTMFITQFEPEFNIAIFRLNHVSAGAF
jgi:hypothetical protein